MKWYNIDEGEYPEFGEPVLLAKEPTTDLINACRLGRIVVSDDGNQKGWYVDNKMHVIALASRKYWSKLIDEPLGIPNTEDQQILKDLLDVHMAILRLYEKKFQKLAACMISSGEGLYALDYFISGILNRSLSLIYGFETLIGSANFLSAAHLVRPHLDNYLRLSASWIVSDPHAFAMEVWKGKPIRKMRDVNGKLMTDAYLKEKANTDYPWIAGVYEATSGFIHFSDKHIANATKLTTDKESSLTTFIGKVDNQVSYESKIEATIGMIEISNCIAKQVFGWIETKRLKG
jgi:hypothetical protein